MNNILNISSDIVFDNAITRVEIHAHQPYVSSTFNNSDEIRIPIQQQDIYTLPSESVLYIEGKLTKLDGSAAPNTAKIANNGIAHLFDEIRYSLNGVEIDKNKFVGVCSTMKAYVSLNESESQILENAGWSMNANILDQNGYFNVCLPLKLLLGFCEDYKKIIVNVKQELILIRARNDTNAYICADEELKIEITKLQWRVPHIYVDDSERINLLKVLANNKPIVMPFRSWDLYEYPLLPITMKQTWAVKTSTQLEKPRFVIVGFQTDRKNKKEKNASEFDHCKLTNIKLHLNSLTYPYDNLNLNFERNQFALLYEMYTKFQKSYYDREFGPLLDKSKFKTIAPLIVIDCSNQNESLKTASVDNRLEFESSENFPANTTAYCLILHDRLVEYNPLTGTVRILV